MSEEKKLDDNQLDAVAGGAEGAGMLYPGQTRDKQPSDWASQSGLGISGSGFTLDQANQTEQKKLGQ